MGFNEKIAEICGHMKSRKAPIPHGFQNIKESDFRNDTCKQNAEDALNALDKVVRIGVNKGFDNDAIKKAVKGLTNGIMEFANERKMRKDSEIMKVRNNVNAVIADFNAAKISRNENSAMINQVNTWLDQTISGIESAKKFDIITANHQVEILNGYSKRLVAVKEVVSTIVDQNSENAFGYFKKIIKCIKDIRGSIGAKNLNPTVDEITLKKLEETAQYWKEDLRQSKPNKASIDEYKYNPVDEKDPMNYICHAEIAYNAIDSLECDVNDFKETMTGSKRIVEEYEAINNEGVAAKAEIEKIKSDIKADTINNGLTKEQAKAKYGAALQAAMNKSSSIEAKLNSVTARVRYSKAQQEISVKQKTADVLDSIVANIKDQKANPYVYVRVGEIIYQRKDKINKFINPGASIEEMREGATELTLVQSYINDTIKDSLIEYNEIVKEVTLIENGIIDEINGVIKKTETELAGIGVDAGLVSNKGNDAFNAIDDMFDNDEATEKPEENKQEDNSLDGLMNEELNSIL